MDHIKKKIVSGEYLIEDNTLSRAKLDVWDKFGQRLRTTLSKAVLLVNAAAEEAADCRQQTAGVTDRLWVWLTDCGCDWQTAGVTDRLRVWLTDCGCELTDCGCDWQTVGVTDRLRVWLTDCGCDWQTVGVTDRLRVWLTDCGCDWQTAYWTHPADGDIAQDIKSKNDDDDTVQAVSTFLFRQIFAHVRNTQNISKSQLEPDDWKGPRFWFVEGKQAFWPTSERSTDRKHPTYYHCTDIIHWSIKTQVTGWACGSCSAIIVFTLLYFQLHACITQVLHSIAVLEPFHTFFTAY